MQLLVPRRLNARSTAAQEAGQRAAIEAVRKFVDTVDEVIPALGDRPSRRETLIDAALDMADKLVTTQYEFLRSVVRSVDRTRPPGEAHTATPGGSVPVRGTADAPPGGTVRRSGSSSAGRWTRTDERLAGNNCPYPQLLGRAPVAASTAAPATDKDSRSARK